MTDQLMRDVGEEGRLGAIEPSELLGPHLLRLEAGDARKAAREREADQLDPAVVVVVERSSCVEADDEDEAPRMG
jgi:hypothetical protein